MLFWDIDRLRQIAERAGPLQVVYAGKSHPRDSDGRDVIRRVFAAKEALEPSIRVVYLENYDMALASKIVAGVDLWLNTPLRPMEASGTSGMKAALNGVPSLSILDGWWIEGCVEGVTGWAIGGDGSSDADADAAQESAALYEALERVSVVFHSYPELYSLVRRSAISLNGSFFNTQRMLSQYALNAYRAERPLIPAD